MIKYFNAGNAGKVYSRMFVEDPGPHRHAGACPARVQIRMEGELDIQLNAEQVRNLRNSLTTWLRENSRPVDTMIVGDTI